MKASVELCINKFSDAAAKSELEADCGELTAERRMTARQVAWRFARASKDWQIDYPHTQKGRQD